MAFSKTRTPAGWAIIPAQQMTRLKEVLGLGIIFCFVVLRYVFQHLIPLHIKYLLHDGGVGEMSFF